MNNKGNSQFKKIISSKSFYVAFMCCMLAAAVFSISIFRERMNPKSEKSTTTSTTVDWYNQGGTVEEQAGVNVTGQPDTRSTQTTTPQQTTQATTKEDTNVPFKSYYALPLGTSILKDYSNGEMVRSKTMGDWRVHDGVDFKGNQGDKIKAINNGTVKKVYEDVLWGIVVEIEHGGGLVAKYCGLNKDTTPKEGSKVQINDTIGTLGIIPIEAQDGAHLHLEIRINDKVVDPLAAMSKVSENS